MSREDKIKASLRYIDADDELSEWMRIDADPDEPMYARVAEHLAIVAFLRRVLPPSDTSDWLRRRVHGSEASADSQLGVALRRLQGKDTDMDAIASVVRAYQGELVWRLLNAIHEGAEVVPFSGSSYSIGLRSEEGLLEPLDSLFELLVQYGTDDT